MREQGFFSRFVPPAGDPLAVEHEVVSDFIHDALASLGKDSYWKDLDLKSQPSGKAILDASPEQGRRFLLAALAQGRHWEQALDAIQKEASRQRSPVSHLEGWGEIAGPHRQNQTVLQALLRRALPLQKDDVAVLLDYLLAGRSGGDRANLPAGLVVKTIERFAADKGVDNSLRGRLRTLTDRLRASYDKSDKRAATVLGPLCEELQRDADSASETPALPPPRPAPAGNPRILATVKQKLGMSAAEDVAATETGPDRFKLRADSPLTAEHAKLSAVFAEAVAEQRYWSVDLRTLASGPAILDTSPTERARLLLAAAERRIHADSGSSGGGDTVVSRSRYIAMSVVGALRSMPVELDRVQLLDVVLYYSTMPGMEARSWKGQIEQLLDRLESEVSRTPLSEGERFVLSQWRSALQAGPLLGVATPEVKRLSSLIGDGALFFLVPGEAWSDAINAALTSAPKSRAAWKALLVHAMTATSSRPSEKWLKTGRVLMDAIGADAVRESLATWLGLMPKGLSFRRPGTADTIPEENATCLRGFLWLVPLLPLRDGLARTVSAVALSAYKKIPGVGARAVRVGNAAIYALSELGSTDSVGQLAMLKVRVKFGTAQKEIEKAFDASAAALGLPRDQVEEMGVPSYGLEEVGRLKETVGEYQAEILVTGSDATLKWSDLQGKALKSAPAALKKDHGEELKELQQSLKDIQAMLPAQRDRIDALFLAQKSWPVAAWRERYLEHPLVGSIARRLIWCVDGQPALFVGGAASDVSGKDLRVPDGATITTWHPVGRSIEEITSWRRRLEALAITQPFKQAHREIYLLTDAERRTVTYSNRFAAHVLRQHQFNALCGARGWKNKLRLMVDDSYPPASRDLPQWGLRAEFWIEGIGTTYGADTNESGVFLRVATDQVRFYRRNAAESRAHAGGGGYAVNAGGPGTGNINDPLPLDLVPPLVFSEIMRDVDLFVGVGSVGNDPTWQDGGPQGRFQTYWQSVSFGELNASAATRREVLQRLVPRLKIADRCSFADRFLVVRGDKRTYKIHLGSGNILMEPNDQYLCIVPDQRARTAEDNLYLPFEGDSVLSIILSKAFLLAADSRIKDQTIVRQLEKV